MPVTSVCGADVSDEKLLAELRTVKQRLVSQHTFSMLDRDSEVYRGHLDRLDAEIDKLLAGDGQYWAVYDKVRHPNISMNGSAFTKPLKLAAGYRTQGSRYYRSDKAIKACEAGLRHLMQFVYPDCPMPYNWWAWQIGIPRQLLPTLILLEGYLDKELYAREVDTVRHLLEAHKLGVVVKASSDRQGVYHGSTDTNTLWRFELQLQYSVLIEDIAAAKVWAARSFNEIAPAGQGHIQADYSFKFHGQIPMWAYGSSFLIDYSELIYRYHGLSFGPTPEQLELFYQMATHYVNGFLYRGCICPAIIGRTLTRSDCHHHHSYGPSGFAALAVLVRADHPEAGELARTVAREKPFYLLPPQRWDMLTTGRQGNYRYGDSVSGTMQPLAAKMAYVVQGLPEVEPAPPVDDIFAYPDSDFMQITRPDWAVGIKLHSSRNRPFESINGENMQGWFLSHGSMFHFVDGHEWDGCWPTLDWTRLPGTTATTDVKQCNESPFAGVIRGSRDVGLAALELRAKSFQARKSWLVNSDHIVCMGSDIAGPGRVETTIINQPVAADTQLLIDGEPAPDGLFEKNTHARSLWLGDVCYVFPEGQELLITRTRRTSNYDSVRNPEIHGPSKAVTHLYLTAVVRHTLSKDSYCYLFAPHVKRDDLAARTDALARRYSLISDGPHRVAEEGGEVEAAVLWEPGSAGDVQADRGCMVLRTGDAWQVVDPVWSSETLNVNISGKTFEAALTSGRPVELSLQTAR